MGCLFSHPDIETNSRRFKIKKRIANGGFSEVFLTEDMDSGEKFAMKRISMIDENDSSKIQSEIDMHIRFGDDPNIVPLICDARPEELIFCLFFPFYSHGTVSILLETNRQTHSYLSQSEVVTFFSGVCKALKLMHTHSYAHRDLKPANILISNDRKSILTDFGSSALMPINISNSRESQQRRDEAAEMSSMPYRAPELFTCEIDTQITVAVDIWSLGCLLYAFCFFISPFDLVYEKGNSIALAVQSPHTIIYPSDSPYDSSIISLIRSMLTVEVENRPSIDNIMEQLDVISSV